MRCHRRSLTLAITGLYALLTPLLDVIHPYLHAHCHHHEAHALCDAASDGAAGGSRLADHDHDGSSDSRHNPGCPDHEDQDGCALCRHLANLPLLVAIVKAPVSHDRSLPVVVRVVFRQAASFVPPLCPRGPPQPA